MTLRVRAVYEQGRLRLLEPVTLDEGQHVTVSIEDALPDAALRAALGDLVRWPDPTDDRYAEVESEAVAIDLTLSPGRPASEIVIEDRGEV